MHIQYIQQWQFCQYSVMYFLKIEKDKVLISYPLSYSNNLCVYYFFFQDLPHIYPYIIISSIHSKAISAFRYSVLPCDCFMPSMNFSKRSVGKVRNIRYFNLLASFWYGYFPFIYPPFRHGAKTENKLSKVSPFPEEETIYSRTNLLLPAH